MTPLYEEILPGGAMWSMRIVEGRELVLETLGRGANVSALFFNAINTLDRLNVPDTLKALHTAKLTHGHVLMSDMGLSLVSITGDSLGWHDPLGGHSTAKGIESTFGSRTYQEVRNGFFRNARDNFLVELSKWGLGVRDLVANVNFFSKVTSDEAGRLSFVENHAPAGSRITLRTDVPVIAIFANCPHPMHPGGEYPFVDVRLTLTETPPASASDPCRNFRPECARALELSERFLL